MIWDSELEFYKLLKDLIAKTEFKNFKNNSLIVYYYDNSTNVCGMKVTDVNIDGENVKIDVAVSEKNGAVGIDSNGDERTIDDNSEVIEQLRQIEVPKVIVTSPGIEGIDCVLHDPYTAYQLAMRKLVETGHKRICSLNCPKYYRTWMLRAKSLQDSEKELNISLDPDMQISPDNMTPHSVYELFSALIDSGKKPDAVIALSDDYTMSVLRCLYERGLRVPDDISIISAEDSNICGNLSPAITAVNIQKEAIGNKALNFLLDRINHPELPAREITVTPYLVMRDSVANRK